MSSDEKPTRSRIAPITGSRAARVESASRVLRQFRIVFNAVKSHFRAVEKKAGLAGAQLWALSVIGSTPGVGVNELAMAMDIHQSTASNLVRSLIANELVIARREGADKRTVQLHALPRGMKVLRRAPGPYAGVLPAALASLDARTLLRLEKDLQRLITGLNVTDRAGRVPLGER